MATTTATTSSIGSVFQSQTQSAADKSNKMFSDNGEMYLGLFLAQLKNQDPTQPFDTAQMTEQLSQLNSSQQMIQTNKNLEQLIAQNKSSQASSLASFINKDIEYLGDTFYRDGIGNKDFSYSLDKDYSKVDIEVRDIDDNLIYKTTGSASSGSHNFTWDGKDTAGNLVDVGTYKVTATTKDFDNVTATRVLGNAVYSNTASNNDFSYIVDREYSNVDIEIRDGNNALILKVPGDKSTGAHKFSWDGKDAAGKTVASGTYKIGAVTKDSSGIFGNVSTFIKATVSGIDFSSSSEPVVLVGNGNNRIGVDLSRIASVMDKVNLTNSTNTTTATN